ncbi:MAG TPA: BREX-1 system adenine-specific DNA-methyltransferase PglX, partial [Pyrinomonadaceae bacterium]|nr:BREX-1 system adenine-specific DNA-methyltransferase PglX [Pyrinomonadaceae bacterium]
MNKAKLKTYAPQARKDFIQMIRGRADLLGLTKREIEQPRAEGEIAVIEGRPYPRAYAELHKRLAEKIKTEGLEPFVERIAYSWFNRFAALRFMEVNNFLSHGFRVLSNRETGKNEPEILTHAAEINLPGLDKEEVIKLKLAGNKDAELYKMLLIAQCNELHRAMPFLFERINDETEILLPDNLLHSDSVIRKMVGELSEDNWRDSVTEEPIVEVIGWLYQFYISEKKDEVIGKTVKSEDIPAATQLFTPNWIVKYMTQNSLGRLWLENNPNSQLTQNMEFYIKPAEENSNPKSEIQNPKSAISPEEIRVLDPACGSGHILVEAYELLKLIYTERGYSSRDIPLLILEKNLFGLDIDERAAQMASFALLMKARKDDRRIFERLNGLSEKQIPNVLTVPDSSHLPNTAREIAEMFFSRGAQAGAVPIRDGNYLFDEMQTQRSLVMSDAFTVAVGVNSGVSEQNVIDLLELFEQGKTLGSLIRIPHGFGAVVDRLETMVEAKRIGGDTFEQVAVKIIEPFVRAAKMLANKYDCVIANPPYMGSKYQNSELKAFAAKNFPDSRSDLFAMFIERNFELAKFDGFNAMVTMQSWMFLSSYEKMRERLISEKTIITMAHLGARAFVEISGEVVQTTVFSIFNKHLGDYKPTFFRLVGMSEVEKVKSLRNNEHLFSNSRQDDFNKIPGSPVAYWVSEKVRKVFERAEQLGNSAPMRNGMTTGDNDRFMRNWFEVSKSILNTNAKDHLDAINSKCKWFPYSKGGELRKWYGNNDYVVNWANDGAELKASPNSVLRNPTYYFKEALTWSLTGTSGFGARFRPHGSLFDVNGMSMFPKIEETNLALGLLNSKISNSLLLIINPTIAFQVGDIARIPKLNLDKIDIEVSKIAEEAVAIARADWDSFEASWDFKRLPIADCGLRSRSASVEECWQSWKNLCDERITRMQQLETENNRLFIEAYGLEDELSPEVPLSQITLARADAEKDTRRLLSYFVGCLMGRYSLDETGLIYADAGGKGFNPARYQTFPADDDGILPVTDIEWFPQEAARQFEQFVRAVWGEANQTANLRWIAGQLGGKQSETPIETVRRYFSNSFFKDHLQTYKKRPIYW